MAYGRKRSYRKTNTSRSGKYRRPFRRRVKRSNRRVARRSRASRAFTPYSISRSRARLRGKRTLDGPDTVGNAAAIVGSLVLGGAGVMANNLIAIEDLEAGRARPRARYDPVIDLLD